jgi:hypothetical protein
MAMNHIQFQHGLSMPEFSRCFGSESPCAAALEAARWLHGFAARAAGRQRIVFCAGAH